MRRISKVGPQKRVYYAHAMCLYGSARERAELSTTRRKFRGWQIVNPAEFNNHPEKRADTLGFCFRLVEQADSLVFSRLLGKITAGVGAEVNHALSLGRPVFEIRGGKFIPRTRTVAYLSREATLDLYSAWRRRAWGV